MCGIIGYVGENAAKTIVSGLKRLEYRGYDSSGIAVQGDKITVVKSVGRVEELEKKGYYVRINLSYDVYYNKDYTFPIGYAGSPKYEVTLLNEKLVGFQEKDLTTTTSTKTKTFTWTQVPEFFNDESFTLTFSTDNIQNTIYFKNITVTYECVKAN